MIEKISKYVLAHERLLIVVGVIALTLFLGNKWINHEAKVAELENSKAQAVAAQQAIVVQNLTSQLAVAQKNSDAVVAQTSLQVSLLQGQIAALQANLAQQQQKIKSEPLPDLAVRWNDLVGGGVQNTDKGLVVSETAARTTVSQLVEIPVLNQTIQAQTSELVEKDKAIAAQAGTISASTSLIVGLNTQLSENSKACKTQIDLEIAKSRKSKRNFFIAGFIAGIGTRIFGKF